MDIKAIHTTDIGAIPTDIKAIRTTDTGTIRTDIEFQNQVKVSLARPYPGAANFGGTGTGVLEGHYPVKFRNCQLRIRYLYVRCQVYAALLLYTNHK